MIKNSIKLLTIVFLINPIINNVSAQNTYSQIWGKKGEKWDRSRIPDFTNAGYKQGKKNIPVYKNGVNVLSFGAKGDGITDDTQAFKKSIAACKVNQAVFIPAGVYLLTDTIQIRKSGISIKGDKKGQTILLFNKGIEELYPKYNLEYKNQTPWSWSGAMLLFTGNISDSGAENLTIKFPDNKWDGHNFHERCYNAIGFDDGAHDGWIRNVIVTGTDIAIWIGRTAHHITAEKLIIDFGPVRLAEKLNGHHCINLYGGYNLIQDFEIRGKYHHDLSVESSTSIYNVFRNGKGTDMCIDHHNHDQSHNLFTNLNMGEGTRFLYSGGNDKPRGICSNETFWNITAKANLYYCDYFDTKDKQSKNNVAVGIKTDKPSILGDKYGNWFESINPEKLNVKDLYKAQMKLIRNKRIR